MQTDERTTFLHPLEDAFLKAGHQLFLVGGYVRNRILGLPISDIDLCGTASPDEAIALANSAGYHTSLRSCELGTVDIQQGEERAEYTPFRIESYAAGGAHRPVNVTFTTDINLDARRRDFTINALYQRIQTQTIVDPLGGLPDLERKRLRACGNTAGETLMDDGLRILRMVRFCAELGFSPEDDLLGAARTFAQNLSDLSPSRIYGEWQRICLCDLKYPDFSSTVDKAYYAMELLHQSGALFVLMPTLYEAVGVAQNPKYHRYDVFFHSLHCFSCTCGDVVLRTAALLHDIGKPACSEKQEGRMHGHPAYGAVLSQPILDVLGLPNKMCREILLLIERHMFDLNGNAKRDTIRIRFANWGFGFAQKLIALRKGDVSGSGMDSNDQTAARWEEILAAMQKEGAIDQMRLLAIDGDEIGKACQLPPGKRIGRIKQILFDRCAVKPAMNRSDILLREAISLNRQLSDADDLSVNP